MTENNTKTGAVEPTTLKLKIPLEPAHEQMVDDLGEGGVDVDGALARQPNVIQAVERTIYQLHSNARHAQER